MKESDLNRIIKLNINEQDGWCEKISDSAGIAAKMASKNPFDLFGITENYIFYFESKLSKKWEAFAFSRIEDHQINNLLKIREIVSSTNFPVLTCITFAIWLPRKDIELFVFSIGLIEKLIKEGKKSINKKELEKLSNDKKSIIIKKKYFDIKLLKEKVIYEL